MEIAGIEDFCHALRKRDPYSNKRENGKVFIVGGNGTFHGAPVLASTAAYSTLAAMRTGSGYAITCVPEQIVDAVRKLSPDIIVKGIPGKSIGMKSVKLLESEADKADSIVIGPGIGREKETEKAIARVVNHAVKSGKCVIVDADAIGALKGIKEREKLLITPNDNEFHKITGKTLPVKDLKARVGYAKNAALRFGTVILLKGHDTIVTDGKMVKVIRAKTAALATMGSGDVLSGIIGGLSSGNGDVFSSAIAGAFVHTQIGDYLYSKKGYHILASDIVDAIPEVMKKLERRCR